MDNYSTLLNNIGISVKEFNTYKKLYELGPSTIMELSKALSMPRTTVYQHIDKLSSKGLIAETFIGTSKKLIAEKPLKFKSLLIDKEIRVESELKEIAEGKNLIDKLVKDIGNISLAEKIPDTDVKLYKGQIAISKIYDEILNSEKIKTFVDADIIKKLFPLNQQKFLEAVFDHNKEVWDLLEYGKEAKDFWVNIKHPKYHIKFFPINFRVKAMDYLLFDDKVAMIYGTASVQALIIKNKLLHDNIEIIYDLLWSLLPEPTK